MIRTHDDRDVGGGGDPRGLFLAHPDHPLDVRRNAGDVSSMMRMVIFEIADHVRDVRDDGDGAWLEFVARCYYDGVRFQEARRSSVKARCSGKQVLADEGDGAQRQRSAPAGYFWRLRNNARMQLFIVEVKNEC